MNRTQAMKEAVRLFGKRAAVRDEKIPTDEATRKGYSAQIKLLRELKGLTPAEDKVRKEQIQKLLPTALRYRYSVGYIGGGGLFFSVQGQGDTWEEAFSKVDPIYKKAAA